MSQPTKRQVMDAINKGWCGREFDVEDAALEVIKVYGQEAKEELSIQEVLDKYFPEGKTKYFHQSDAHCAVEGDTYLRYAKYAGVELWMGGSNGEVCILHTKSAEALEKVIKAILYP